MLRGCTMPLNEIDTNTSRRSSFSRSSDVSNKPARQDARSLGPSSQLDNISKSAGVQSMLKTTTEDDLSSLALKSSRLPKHLQGQPRRQHGVPPSRPSSHYSRNGSRAGSIRSKSSNRSASDHQPLEIWPYVHYPRASSVDIRHNRADDGNGIVHPSSRSVASISDKHDADQRSFSLTQNLNCRRGFSNHRSASSLRNQATNSPRPQSPYIYPSRLRRQGLRPASPALSDTNAITNAQSSTMRPALAPRTFTGSPVAQFKANTHNSSPLRPLTRELHPQPAWRTNGYANYGANSFKSDGSLPIEARSLENRANTPPLAPVRNFNPGRQANLQQNSSSSPFTNSVESSDRKSQPKPRNAVDGPYAGFVKRVKQALEDRAITEVPSSKSKGDRPAPGARIETVDSNAKTVQSPEIKRLTRDMIKAAVGPPSDSGAISPTPEAIDTNQGETSLTESSSTRAYASFDVPRAPSLPQPPSDVNEITTSIEEADSSNAQPSLHSEKINMPSTVVARHDNTEEPIPPDVTLAVSADSPLQPTGLYEELVEENVVPELESNSSVYKRPSSLPQPDVQQPNHTKLNRHSLSALFELDARPSPTFGSSHATDRSSNAGPSFSSLPTEITVVNEVITGPSSTHSFFRSNSNGSGEMGPLSAFKSYFRSKTRPYSTPSEPKSDTDMEHKIKPILTLESRPAPPTLKTSLPRATPELNEVIESSHLPGSGTDRLSAMKQYQFTLPDLAEDSQEDASTTNIRILGSKTPNFRSGALKRAKREHRVSNQPTITLEPPPSYVSRKLKDTRNMPSLQFSQTDLTTKLNNALGFPCSISKEDLAAVLEHSPPEEPTPPSTVVRQRYKSFFAGQSNPFETEDTTTDLLPEDPATKKILLTEIDRLSIPSVNGLTLRLSELLPSIKTCHSKLDLTGTNEDVENSQRTIDPGSELDLKTIEQRKMSLMSVLSAGSAARLRRSEIGGLAPSSLDVEKVIKKRLMKDLPPLPKDSSENMSGSNTNIVNQSENTGDMPAELEATVPIEGPSEESRVSDSDEVVNRVRARSSTAGISSPVGESDGLTTGMQLNGSSWAQPSPAVEISPLDTGHKTNVSRMNKSNSNKLTPDTTERIVRSMSPGPHVDNFLVPRSEAENELEQVSTSGKGFFESIQRKIGKKPRIDKAGFPVDPIFLHPEERSTEPGDRYPTSGLTPPSNVNMEEARSYFSDDSSENDGNNIGPLRKRLTRLKYRRSRNRQSTQTRTGSRANSVPEPGMEIHHGLRWDDDEVSRSERSTLSVSHPDFVVVYDQQPVGMSKLEFRAKRLIEKLRIFWSKSESLIRSLSRAKRDRPTEWLEANDLYEGV